MHKGEVHGSDMDIAGAPFVKHVDINRHTKYFLDYVIQLF